MSTDSQVRQLVNKMVADFGSDLDLLNLKHRLFIDLRFDLQKYSYATNGHRLTSVTGSFLESVNPQMQCEIALDPLEDEEIIVRDWEVLESDIKGVDSQLKTMLQDVKDGFITMTELIKRLEAENSFIVQWIDQPHPNRFHVTGYFQAKYHNILTKSLIQLFVI